MRQASVFLVGILLLLGVPSAAADSFPSWATVLGSNAHVRVSVSIPGSANVQAVLYQDPTVYLAVVTGSDQSASVIWRRQLPALPQRVLTPGPLGLFEVRIRLGSHDATFEAFEFHSGRVQSAVAGESSGKLLAKEGLSIHGLTISARNRDTAHVGSVNYRVTVWYRWSAGLYRPIRTSRAPDYPAANYPFPNAVDRTDQGNTVLLRLEIADTEPERERGLMFRHSLDPDSGMIFVFPGLVTEPFWMENTYIPLSIAFLSTTGRIQEIQDMAPQTTINHVPARPYRYSIEVNQGFFARNGVRVGDTLELNFGLPSNLLQYSYKFRCQLVARPVAASIVV